MNSENPSEPDEPHIRSEPHIISPASPKPIAFPRPANIPVLEKQMDVGFNQTEHHMNDPAMHNTEVRPDFWRDPREEAQRQAEADTAQQGTEAVEGMDDQSNDQFTTTMGNTGDHSTGGAENPSDQQSVNLSSEVSHNATVEPHMEASALAPATDLPQPYLDSNVPAASIETNGNANQTIHVPSEGQAQPVDVQALLGSFSNEPISSTATNAAPSGDSMTVTTTLPPAPSDQSQLPAPGTEDSSLVSGANLAGPPSGLPPRPPPQEQPFIHPHYTHSQHIQDYHPHAPNTATQHTRTGSQSSAQAGNVGDLTSPSYVPTPGGLAASPATAEPTVGYSQYQTSPTTATNQTLQSPLNAKFPVGANSSIESRRETKIAAGQTPTADDRPWDGEVQKKYDRFIDEERNYVSEGRWDQFPYGSRLFVGNLSSEKVTKRDIFHVFHRYGDLAQISIKQAYGFVQFLRNEDCARALEHEQGRQIREKRIHLEVSKPQKNRVPQPPNPGPGRRSRSPDYGRGPKGRENDRYSGGRRNSGGRNSRDGGRDGYRGYRSPTPPRHGSPRHGYRDRFEGRYRSRSRSPGYRRADRYRSPSPQRDEGDGLPLPRRNPKDVPDVQIIVLEILDRQFVSWVERAFSQRNVRVDVLLLSPQLDEQAVIRRQIVEGVLAVTKLTRRNQDTAKIGLRIFDRRQGTANVSFEEYDGQDPSICAELVLRAKATQPPPQPAYGGGLAPYSQSYGNYGGSPQPPHGPYGAPPPGFPPGPFGAAPPGVPNLQNMITALDPASLQGLISAMNQPAPNAPQSAGSGPPYGQQGFAQQQQQLMQALQNNPAAVASLMQQQQQQQQPSAPPNGSVAPRPGPPAGSGVNMQDILARLGTYKQ